MKTTSEKIKNVASNKKMVLGILAFLLIIAIVFVSSIFPLIIDPSKWGTNSFITNELILIALTIISMVCFVFIGQSGNAMNEASELAKSRVKFFKSLDLIQDKITAFLQWVHYVQEIEDQKNKNLRILHSHGLDNIDVLELSESELKNLLKEPYSKETPKGKRYFSVITKEQYKAILSIKKGKSAIEFVAPESYLVLNKLDNNKTISERLANQQKKKTSTLTYSVLSKCMGVLIVGLIFGGLAKDLSSGGTQTEEIIINLFSRLFNCVTSAFMGYIVGGQINDIDAEYINLKCIVHSAFLNDKEFKPLTEQEKAKKDFIEFAKKKEEENRIMLGYNE